MPILDKESLMSDLTSLLFTLIKDSRITDDGLLIDNEKHIEQCLAIGNVYLTIPCGAARYAIDFRATTKYCLNTVSLLELTIMCKRSNYFQLLFSYLNDMPIYQTYKDDIYLDVICRASVSSDVDFLKMILSTWPEFNLNTINASWEDCRQTPLTLATSPEIVSLLLQHHADPHFKDNNDQTLFDLVQESETISKEDKSTITALLNCAVQLQKAKNAFKEQNIPLLYKHFFIAVNSHHEYVIDYISSVANRAIKQVASAENTLDSKNTTDYRYILDFIQMYATITSDKIYKKLDPYHQSFLDICHHLLGAYDCELASKKLQERALFKTSKEKESFFTTPLLPALLDDLSCAKTFTNNIFQDKKPDVAVNAQTTITSITTSMISSGLIQPIPSSNTETENQKPALVKRN